VSFFGSVILVHVVAIALSVLFAIDLPIRALVGVGLGRRLHHGDNPRVCHPVSSALAICRD
jgi:hypothetical protein